LIRYVDDRHGPRFKIYLKLWHGLRYTGLDTVLPGQ